MARKTVGLSRAEFDSLNQDFPREYPTNLGAAVDELRQRGYDARGDTLNYLIRRGVVDEAKDGPRSLPSWTKKRIDQAAKWMEQQQMFSPKGAFWNFMDIDALQYEQATWEARLKFGSPEAAAMVVFPGQPKTVAYVHVEKIKGL